jgi:glycosyltransferase involved in cell wall biosynthesis
MTTNSEVLLSIVIPTKNRYETLSVITNYIMSWEQKEFELIIQDNTLDSSAFSELLKKYANDSRFKYYHETREMSAIENCDKAVSNANGKFVCFIGDDDGVTRQTIDACKWMKAQDIDALYCARGSYTWPDMEHAISINKKTNGLLMRKVFTNTITEVDPQKELKNVMKSGAQNLYNLPRLYQGIIAKESLNKLYDKTHSYFPGPVPDMSNAVGLAPFLKKCFFIDTPIIISGHSKKSMSGKNSVRQHQGDIRQEKSLPANTYDIWTPTIPRYWCAPTIWAEAAIKAAERTGQEDILQNFNYTEVYANCMAYSNKRFYPLIYKSMTMGKNPFSILTISIKVLFAFALITFDRTVNFLRKIWGNKNKGEKFSNIEEAIISIESKIGSLKFQ